ncbi:MAG: amino acid permease, partial [Brevibacterium sp.]|nr:amino acid permease [Brevibacterium sp.]
SLRGWGIVVNIAALAYGIFAMILLSLPGDSGSFFSDWIVLIGLVVVLVAGFIYLFVARPDRKSDAPEGDAIAVADAIRSHHSNH